MSDDPAQGRAVAQGRAGTQVEREGGDAMIYALVFAIPEQRAIIERVCLGSCGRIIVGGIMDGQFGELAVCRTDAADCPALDRQIEEPCGEVAGEPVTLRKLKARRCDPRRPAPVVPLRARVSERNKGGRRDSD